MAEVKKIVLTGGPCGGKTSAKKYLKDYFEQHGFNVVFVAESATEIIQKTSNKRGTIEFQREVYENQLKNEENALNHVADKTLIVCDRGTMDAAAYCDNFESFLADFGSNIVSEQERYDGIFYLESAACGAQSFYTNDGGIRCETVEESRILDAKTLSAWVGHNHLRVIKNEKSFEEKMQNLVKEVAFFVGLFGSLEIEKKFLIEKPTFETLSKIPFCRWVNITQVYLKSTLGGGRRIRNRGGCFYYTEKNALKDGVREEIERKISAEEYERLLIEADEKCAPICKTRYCFVFDGKYFELDVFPFMQNTAFLEIELKALDEKFSLPPFVTVLRDVSDDSEYTNRAMAIKLKNKML